MCGIAGFIDLRGARTRAENNSIAGKMGDCIRHRGPDSGGLWSDPAAGIWLAFRRLAIIDLSEAGNQPMSTPDGRGHIIFNGQVYNSAELRPELEAAGYHFRGHSDTEVLLYGCRHWGVERTVSRLIGMFAFAYWDGEERILTLVRDRVGKKPLYFSNTSRAFLFASELRPLMVHPDCPSDIDRSSATEFLRTHYIAAPFSIFQGVEKLEPGELLVFRPATGKVSRKRYWNLLDRAAQSMADPWTGTLEEAVDAAEALIRDATTARLVSDVPLGALLSGGIDSSAVVAMMRHHASGPVRTFSIGYADEDYDEARHARAIADHLGTEHTELIAEPNDALSIIPSLPEIFDEPFGDMSQIPTWLVSKLARQHVKVVLSGDGGDEVFGGYNRHVAAARLLPWLGILPRPARLMLAGIMRSLSPDRWQRLFAQLPLANQPRAAGEKIHKLAQLLVADDQDRYLSLVSNWQNPAEAVIDGSERHGLRELQGQRDRFPDLVAFMRYLDLVTWLPGDVLTKVDRASMAVSLEVRAPLLDHRLIEFSFRIPSSVHIHGGTSKWLLRKVLERSVPRHLFERPKMGFGIPLDKWLRGPLRDWAEDLLSSDRLRAAGLLRPEPIRKIWEEHLSGTANAQYQLWPVLMLQAWLEHWKCRPNQVSAAAKVTAAPELH